MADEKKPFRVHLKSGAYFLVKAHHFANKISAGTHATVPFFKNETEVDDEIFVVASEVAAIVAQEQSEPPELPGSTGYQSY